MRQVDDRPGEIDILDQVEAAQVAGPSDSSSPYADFGKRLRAIRLQANITTQRGLVELLADKGVYYDYTVVSHWESGRRCPPLEVLIAIIWVLVEAGGIKDVATANELLQLANVRNLNKEETAQVFGHTCAVGEQKPPAIGFSPDVSPFGKPATLLWSQHSDNSVVSVDVSADGSRILVGTLGKQVVCFDRNGEVLWSAQVGNHAWRVALSADGRVAVVSTGSTRPWDMEGRKLYTFGDDGRLLWQRDWAASV